MSDPQQTSRGPTAGARQQDSGPPGDELSMLRDDITRLTESVTEMLRNQAGVAGDHLRDVASDAYATAQETAGIFSRAGGGVYEDARGRLDTLSTELTDTVRKAPLISLALFALLGMVYGRIRR